MSETQGERAPRVRLALRSPCNADCVFCRPAPSPPTPLEEAEAQLRQIHQPGAWLLIGGDEPTTHPGLPLLLSQAHELGFAGITLQTTGQAFATPGLASALRELGLSGVDIPIYGANAAQHEAVTRTPGSFARLLRGLDQLRRVGLDILLHTIVVRGNVTSLADLLRFCRQRGAPLGRVEQLQPDRNYDYPAHAVSLAHTAGALAEVPAALLAGVHLANYPLCFARLLAERAPALPAPALSNGPGTAFRPKRHAAPCEGCGWRQDCEGLYEGYLAQFGDDELRPA